MYEEYYGFTEKPFSLTPDPKYLYRSQSHANAFELLQYAIQRREGFVVVTGDIGTGKTTLCRALLEQIDQTTVTALILNPFLSEEDLLKRILQDFGVVSRADVKAGRLAGVSKQELIDTLYDFLLGLIPLKASAVVIIDEAQNLPLHVLEQIRILSNLETDKDKLLQIILVGQLNLHGLLRSPGLRQLDQRVSIRYELKPLDAEAAAAYVRHRLTIAGGSGSVAFTSQALALVHKISSGIPRLINLLCDRALLAGFSVQAARITPEMVRHAAKSLDIPPLPGPRFEWLRRRASVAAGAAVVLLAAASAVGLTAFAYQRFMVDTVQARGIGDTAAVPFAAAAARPDRKLPAGTALTVLVESYPESERSEAAVRELTAWLEASGHRVYYERVDLGPDGRWWRVLAGTYAEEEYETASWDAARLKAAAPVLQARVVTISSAGRTR
jgi:type II secretory pathway predicted ATPase ExeA